MQGVPRASIGRLEYRLISSGRYRRFPRAIPGALRNAVTSMYVKRELDIKKYIYIEIIIGKKCSTKH